MGLKKDVLERQLALATNDLNEWNGKLDADGVDVKSRRRDPQWRRRNARCREIRNRIAAVDAIAAREAECAQRKQEKVASEG